MFETIALVGIFLFILIILSLVVYARWNYGVLEKLGIPVVKPTLLLGSSPDLHLKVTHMEDIERYKKYGPVFGVYEGRQPHIFICDPELVHFVTVEDYEHFKRRREIDFGFPVFNEFIDFQPYDKWKVLRSLWTPHFTSSKIKTNFGPRINEAVKDLATYMDSIGDKNGNICNFQVRELYGGFLIDSQTRAIYGLKLDDPYGKKNHFKENLDIMNGIDQEINFMYTLILVFPFLIKILPSEFGRPIEFMDTFHRIIKDRMASGNKQNDLLDGFVEAYKKTSTDENYKKVGITEVSIISQAVTAMIAGFEPMASVMSFLSFVFASNKEIQEKAYKEVNSHFQAKKQITMESLAELPYLTGCVLECLRLYPPFVRFERMCTKDWERNGVEVKKGMVVQFPAWALNRHSDSFPDQPEEFKPERFMGDEKNRSLKGLYTYGSGLKNCVGSRLANDSMIIGMAGAMNEYEFKLRENSKMECKPGALFIVKYEPIHLDLIKRKK